jgi:hypothetical protein
MRIDYDLMRGALRVAVVVNGDHGVKGHLRSRRAKGQAQRQPSWAHDKPPSRLWQKATREGCIPASSGCE